MNNIMNILIDNINCQEYLDCFLKFPLTLIDRHSESSVEFHFCLKVIVQDYLK